MGRVLVLLAMLSTASGWKLPSEQSAEPEMKLTGEGHDSPITGGVDGAGDRRRLASSCNGGWSVSPPRPCLPASLGLTLPLPSLDVRSGTYLGASCGCDSASGCNLGCYSCDDFFGGGCDYNCCHGYPASSCECDDPSTHPAGHSTCTSGCTNGCSACSSGTYSAASS